jgi:hypothetical protein
VVEVLCCPLSVLSCQFSGDRGAWGAASFITGQEMAGWAFCDAV